MQPIQEELTDREQRLMRGLRRRPKPTAPTTPPVAPTTSIPLAATRRSGSRRHAADKARVAAKGKKGAANGIYSPNVGADYTPDQLEFLLSVERYKRTRCRPFPGWAEILDVVLDLGYRKVAA
jgi:hypothetical protein